MLNVSKRIRKILFLAIVILTGIVAFFYVLEKRLASFTVNDLIRAIDAQNKREIALILKRRPELVNERNSEGMTVLHRVCGASEPIDIIEFLIENGADVNATMSNNKTALVRAVQHDSTDEVELLLVNGADADATTGDGGHVLFIAAKSGQKDIMKLLVAHGADVNARNREGQTILFYDFVLKDNDFLKTILEKDIDLNVRDIDGMTAIKLARGYNFDQAVKTLIAAAKANVLN
ncbi:MAG: ankyrin repeat domain-containing protein [Planctomycetota bacterium]|jgi:ankyrin repeat protein